MALAKDATGTAIFVTSIVFQILATVAATVQFVFSTALGSLITKADFVVDTKLLKSIVIDSAGGNAGGSPTFLQPWNMMQNARTSADIIKYFFMAGFIE